MVPREASGDAAHRRARRPQPRGEASRGDREQTDGAAGQRSRRGTGAGAPPPPEAGGAGGRVGAGTTTDIPANTGKVVAMGSAPVIVVNTVAGINAFSAVCTHLGCIVGFAPAGRHII